MGSSIIILSTDPAAFQGIISLVKANGYRPCIMDDFFAMGEHCRKGSSPVVVLDLDTIAMNNATLRAFKKCHPPVLLLTVSASPFHPGLKEAMEHYIFACILKPVDPDEFLFLLKSAHDHLHLIRNTPET